MTSNSEPDFKARLISALISVAALIVAAAHLVWPDARIDVVTLGLLVLAVIPWLAPLFKSIELPGGWKVEFQELKQQVLEKGQKVAALSERVEQIESVVFEGKATPEFKKAATEAIDALHAYFEGIGGRIPHLRPTVRVDEGQDQVGFFDGNTLVVGRGAQKNTDLVLRLYSLNVLSSIGPSPKEDLNPYVQSALATYFPCSFKNQPSLGLTPAEAAEEERRTGKPYPHNLEHQREFSTKLFQRLLKSADNTMRVWEIGCLWGGALWEIRGSIGQELADRTFIAAWESMSWKTHDEAGLAWTREVLGILDETARHAVANIFGRRGLVVVGPANERRPK